MSLSDIWNIMLIVFSITGALCWLCMILLVTFYWMCKRPPEEV